MQTNLKVSEENRTWKRWAVTGCWCALLVFGVTTDIASGQYTVATQSSQNSTSTTTYTVSLSPTPVDILGCPVASSTALQTYTVSTPNVTNAIVMAPNANSFALVAAHINDPVFGPPKAISAPSPLQAALAGPIVIQNVEPAFTTPCQYAYQINGKGFGNSVSSASLLVVSVGEIVPGENEGGITAAQPIPFTVVSWSDTQIVIAAPTDIARSGTISGDVFSIQNETTGQSNSFCWGSCTISNPTGFSPSD